MEKQILMKYLKILLISSGVILVFWSVIKISGGGLENFFLWKFSANRDFFSASFINTVYSSRPVRNWNVEDLKVDVESALFAEIDSSDQEKVLFKKNEEEKLSIASLTKLMTALVVFDDYNLSLPVKISEKAFSQSEEIGQLKAGETLTVENLLYIMLMESSNDAAYALSEVLGEDAFVALMNLKGQVIGLNNTHFVNSTGLDSVDPSNPANYSTVEDLLKLTHHLLKKHPIIFKILNLKEFHLYRPDGSYHHKLINTDELLGKIPEIIGGKTGWTPKAKGCLLLILDSPIETDYLVYIILGSNNDKFEEMQKMIDWTRNAYIW